MEKQYAERSDGLHAIVIGGGVAGLLAAHALTGAFDHVTILEKDDPLSARTADETFAQTAKRRAGVPQMVQPHTLLLGGLAALEEILPGSMAELISRGAIPFDAGADVLYVDYGGPFPRDPIGMRAIALSRRLLEEYLYDSLASRSERITLRSRAAAAGLLWSEDGSSIVGIEISARARDATAASPPERLSADLVVDASGRSSRVARWLEEAGKLPAPGRDARVGIAAASGVVAWPEGWDPSREFTLYICKTQPAGKLGGTLLPIEGRRWQVTVAEVGGKRPPRTWDELLEAARRLPDPTMAETLERAEKIGEGLLVVGDAAQGLNPVYGQGMSAAARAARLLRQHLSKAAGASAAADGGRRRATLRALEGFQASLVREVLEPAWQLAAGADLRHPGTKAVGPGVAPPSRAALLVRDLLARAAQSDAAAYRAVLRISHLEAGPGVLLAPAVLRALGREAARAASAALSRRTAVALRGIGAASGTVAAWGSGMWRRLAASVGRAGRRARSAKLT